MRIVDKTTIFLLKGHNKNTRVIRYYVKDNKEEYLLSCDEDKLVIVWDIQNNYDKKLNIKIQDSGDINDALLLFSIINKNYILISSNNKDEYSKLYEFKDDTPLVRNIYRTNENKTNYMIPWSYKNKYYIIECCDYKISIINMLEDEDYYYLMKDSKCSFFCGCIYNDNYLCVNDDNKSIRILDLVNKVIYKRIKYDQLYGREMIVWKNNYIIVGCSEHIVIIDIEEGKKITEFKLGKNINAGGVKNIKLNELGEYLIVSEISKIKLLTLYKNN